MSSRRHACLRTLATASIMAIGAWFPAEAAVSWYGNSDLNGEAVPGGVWDFEGGPLGPLQGWTSTDETDDGTWFLRRTAADFQPPLEEVPIIAGTASMWCGRTISEFAGEDCWIGESGYGNDWVQVAQKAFTYGGSGFVQIDFDYFVDTELGADFVYVSVEVGGVETPLNAHPSGDETGFGYSGALGTPLSPAHATLQAPASLFNGQGPFLVTIRLVSDRSGSDERGGFCAGYYESGGSTYGAFGFDEFTILGTDLNDSDDFESGADGWVSFGGPPAGSYAQAVPLSALDPIGSCDTNGNVLVAEDLVGPEPHPARQFERLRSNPVTLIGGPSFDCVLLELDAWQDLPPAEGVSYRLGIEYFPWVCPVTAVVGWSTEALMEPTYRTTGSPTCSNDLRSVFYDWVPDPENIFGITDLESVRVVIEIRSDDGTLGTTTPYFDNVRLGLATGSDCDDTPLGTFARWSPHDGGTIHDWNDADNWLPPDVPHNVPTRVRNGRRTDVVCVVSATPAGPATPFGIDVEGDAECETTLRVEGSSTTLPVDSSAGLNVFEGARLEIDEATVGEPTGMSLSNAGTVCMTGNGARVRCFFALNGGNWVVKSGAVASVEGIPGPGFINLADGLLCIEAGASLTTTVPITNAGTIFQGAASCAACRASGTTSLTNLERFEAEAPSTIDMTSGVWTLHDAWDIAIDDFTRCDLLNAELVFSSDDVGQFVDVECLAEDAGAGVSTGDPTLFAIGTLRVVGQPGTVRLVDAHDNDGGAGREVLYVDNLVLESGATLDLNGGSIFYGSVIPSDPFDPGSGVTILDSQGGGVLGEIGVVDVGEPLAAPAELRLLANTPNPFASSTVIPFGLDVAEEVSVRVYDVTGRLVRSLYEARLPAGWHEVSWDGRDREGMAVSAGMYFYVLEAGGRRMTHKLVRLP